MDSKDGLARQSCEHEEAEAQLECSTQPDRRRVRESSSFFPNERLGTTVLGDRVLDSSQMTQCADSRQRKMRDKTPGSAPVTCAPFSPGENSYRKKRILHRPGMPG